MNWQQIGENAIGTGLSTALGLVLGKYNDERQYSQQARLQDLQIQGQQRMANFNLDKQMELWEKTNYKAQMEQLKKAGLNPGLIYGMKGGGGATTATQAGSVQGGSAPQGGQEIPQMMGMGLQRQLIQAQKENIEADTKLKETEASYKAGPQTENIQADTENKILTKIITDYTGREAKEVYERVTNPNRPSQAEAYRTGLDAQTAIARNVWELYTEGKLKEQSMAQIESLLIQNAKTIAERKNIEKTMELLEQNIKGATLENVIKELETKMQTETGIDRNSPVWLKILGRLFIGLTQK